jgi:hypothetical protein
LICNVFPFIFPLFGVEPAGVESAASNWFGVESAASNRQRRIGGVGPSPAPLGFYSRFHRNPPFKLKACFIEAKILLFDGMIFKMKMKYGPKVCVPSRESQRAVSAYVSKANHSPSNHWHSNYFIFLSGGFV